MSCYISTCYKTMQNTVVILLFLKKINNKYSREIKYFEAIPPNQLGL